MPTTKRVARRLVLQPGPGRGNRRSTTSQQAAQRGRRVKEQFLGIVEDVSPEERAKWEGALRRQVEGDAR